MKNFCKNNSLSIVFGLLFLISLVGQSITGFHEYNKHRSEDGQSKISMPAYLKSGHFVQATFENWESEFLQMSLFVLFTIFLRQKGSSESKEVDEPAPVDAEPSPQRKGAPWPVKKGGLALAIYKHSLSIAFLILFLFSIALHFYGSLKDENEELLSKHLPAETAGQYLFDSRFWFESFQNWQSEFLSVFCIVLFSVFLREQGSPQSKPVDAADYETGD
ncbi:MAG: hypothetical protein Q7T76_07075 [Ferruginibacter sp.]|nr:hypothetical protein [Ferruginibacter sp.]